MKLQFYFTCLLIFNLMYDSESVKFHPKKCIFLRNKVICQKLGLLVVPDASDTFNFSDSGLAACIGPSDENHDREPFVVRSAVMAAKYHDSMINEYQLDLQSQLNTRLPNPAVIFCYKLQSERKVDEKEKESDKEPEDEQENEKEKK